MPYYGDVSGHFRGLLSGATEVCVVGVVGGPHIDCRRCPQRAIRKVQDLQEAKWNELKDVEKRRFFQCLNENTPPLSFGYATFTRETLHSMDNYHHIYTEESAEPWDIALTAYSYCEILRELTDGNRTIEFYPDGFASGKQCEILVEEIEKKLNYVDIEYVSSTQEKGVQTADCVAGGVREQEQGSEPWLDYIEPESAVEDCRYWAITQLEHLLNNV